MRIPKSPMLESMAGWNDAAYHGSPWTGSWEEGGRSWKWGAPDSFSFRYLKRLIDFLISVCALFFVLSWLLPLLCVFILLDLRDFPFFVQKRVGRYGRSFNCIKLRTMHRGKNGRNAYPTRFGYWLRCLKLDEIPQFFNVLRGEMSIVGPRPHMMADHFAFSQKMGKRYHWRHAVLPGITGLAQVNGYEGAVTSAHKLNGRIRLDIFYIRHWSMALEFRIMYQTIRQFWESFSARGRYRASKERKN